jgi:site-specific DNA recombinase
MTSCALYARYSSDLQSPASIEDQVRLCRAYAARQGWTVVATFEDAARSGFGIEQRPGYQQLLTTALGPVPGFEIILVEDLSRLTRDMAETLRLYHRLRLKGIDLVGVSDGIATSRQGAKVQLAVKGLMNELYLDDLRDKTHRGLSGRVARGLSAGGRIFGYRTVPASSDPPVTGQERSARFVIDRLEAEIVCRIFRDYAGGQSMKAITFALNREGVPFPAKDTKRGPRRRGWAVSTIHTILHNERYRGRWIWNQTRFLKDPDTGRRRPVPRPPEEWVVQERPELRIVGETLWHAVQARLALLAERFGDAGTGRPGGATHVAYSPQLLAGVLRCGLCGARMHATKFTRRKGSRCYTYHWYVCGFAKDKGPTVCPHRVWYPRAWLDGALVGKLRDAMTPPMVEILARTITAHVEAATRGHAARVDTIRAELVAREREVANLVTVLKAGRQSPTVLAELETIETAIAALRAQLVGLERTGEQPSPTVHPAWVHARLSQLETLLREDPIRARTEIMKHLDGDLAVKPLPAEAGQQRVEISGWAKASSLLAGEEAAFVRLVAGAGFEPATFGL